ncbi:MAG TPA: formyltransferase family protein [Pyrinomonadaceae bacterium]|jgi:methionyl-tRNA formyltransferase
MSEKKLKVIVLTHGGAGRLLELLAALETVEITGIYIETATEPKRDLKQKIKRSIRYDGYLATLKKFFRPKGSEELKSVQASQNDLENTAEKLKIPIYKVENYHSQDARNLMRAEAADLGILYGTNIVKEPVFSIPRLGSINIHQGLAPIYRGGPTVFWELFNGEKEIGITVHFVAAKVDTGDIILQKKLPLEYDFSRYNLNYEDFLADFRASLTEPSVHLIAEAVGQIAEGSERRTKQDTSLGKRYRLPTKSEKNALLRVLKKRRKMSKV